MKLSPNTLAHFTDKLSNLKGILQENFRIKYCRETIYLKTGCIDMIIPMVSFCDIPFSQILEHTNKYGKYGIGLKKAWAENQGLTPVFYIEKKSSLAQSIIESTEQIIIKDSYNLNTITKKENIQKKDHIRYMKNYEGLLYRRNKKTKNNYRFSDEREWRYVLSSEIKHVPYGTIPKEWKDEDIQFAKNTCQKLIENERLKFTLEDINYIIIKSEKQRASIIKFFQKIKKTYSFKQIEILTSRIISIEQLKSDF